MKNNFGIGYKRKTLSFSDKSFTIFSHLIISLFSILCFAPFLFIIITSITDEKFIIKNGYSYFPNKYSFSAYNYLLDQSSQILNAYGITILITILGSLASIIITSMLAYPISRSDLPYRRFFSLFIIFTLLFNGGLVPSYITYTQVFNIKNTLLALIIPNLLLNGFLIMIVRTYFTTNLPKEVIESAKIDGAGEFRIFYKVAFPMTLPIFATIAILQGLTYWNDWYNGFIYLTNPHLFSLQNLLNRIISDIQFLASNNQNRNLTNNLPNETIRMALATIAVVPILCIYPIFQKYFINGIVIGAIKG